MALSGTLPVIWGLATGHLNDAVWITLTAEAISWVEMKGSIAWRVRTLFAGAVCAVFFSLLGTVTGNGIWMSVVAMFVVGFLATLLKSIGDRASGLAICVYLMFIICNAFPVANPTEIEPRILMVTIGAAWSVAVGIFMSLFMPVEEPFRRQIALIWRSISSLVDTISKYGNDVSARKFAGAIFEREKEVRAALDSSYDFYGRMVHQVSQSNNRQYQLANLRKVAGLVAVNVVAMVDEMEQIRIAELDEALRVKAATLFSALRESVSRISVFVITLKPEEKLLAVSQINRLRKLIALIRAYPLPSDAKQVNAINRILQLTERTTRLLENAILRIDQMGTDVQVFRSYSLVKSLYVLQPKYLLRNLQVLFNFNTLTARYALRSAIAATLALFVYKWFGIDHGYWLPFSVMIVIQPYFGATFQKAIDRVMGTLLGGLAGSLLLHVPADLHIKEAILFLTFILMVYYIRRRYSIAVFVITLNLVLLFNIQSSYNNMLMVTRAICTIGGSLLAVISGFVFLPAWDKKWLPSHLAGAINCNYEYFKLTFFSSGPVSTWTKNKRSAESKNSDVFDSFNRYMEEPGKEKSETYYDLIAYNVRITRILNNIHLEEEEKKLQQQLPATPQQQTRINECLELFNEVAKLLPDISPGIETGIIQAGEMLSPFHLNDVQMISLEKLNIELKAMLSDLAELTN